MKKAHLHQPAYGLGCATCHQPHGGNNDHLLRAQGNALCLECHGPDSKPKKLEAQHSIAIFNGEVVVPEDYYQKNKVIILPIKYGEQSRDRFVGVDLVSRLQMRSDDHAGLTQRHSHGSVSFGLPLRTAIVPA